MEIIKQAVFCMADNEASRSAALKISGANSGDIVFLTKAELFEVNRLMVVEKPPLVSLDAYDSALIRGDKDA